MDGGVASTVKINDGYAATKSGPLLMYSESSLSFRERTILITPIFFSKDSIARLMTHEIESCV